MILRHPEEQSRRQAAGRRLVHLLPVNQYGAPRWRKASYGSPQRRPAV